MISDITLKRYMKELEQVIMLGDIGKAENLQREILTVLGNDIEGLKQGLTNYEFANFYTNSETGEMVNNTIGVDFLEDARILKCHLQVELEKIEEADNMNEDKMKKVFISHSSKDRDYVEVFVELLENLGLKEQEIVCSSVPPYNIPLDNKVYEWLARQFQQCELHVIYALSENYYSSVASMNEMGAAWVMKHKWTGILMPGFSFDKIEGCIDGTQINIKLDDSDRRTLNYRLDELKDNLIRDFGLDDLHGSRWERKRENFLERIETIMQKRIQEKKENNLDNISVVGIEDVGNISVETAFLLVYAAEADGTILKIESLGSPVQIYVNSKQFFGDNSYRESARWQEALDTLCNWGWVKSTGNNGRIFELTGTGYKKADWLKEEMRIDTDKEPLEELKKFDSSW